MGGWTVLRSTPAMPAHIETAAGLACFGEGLGELAVVEGVVEAVAVEQVGVIALLDDAAAVHDDDRVRVADR